METRFLLPVTVATTLHALLLFGVRWPHEVRLIESLRPPIRWAQPDSTDLRDTPEIAPDDTAKGPKGTVYESRPTNDEEIRQPDRDSFVLPPERPSPVSKRNVSIIGPGVQGLPNGSAEATGWLHGGIIDSAKLDQPPHKRVQVAPIYPADARKEGRTAEVMVEFVVDEQGAVNRARVVRSTDDAFEVATLQAVGKWRFEPGLKNGRPVRFRMLIPVVFMLTE